MGDEGDCVIKKGEGKGEGKRDKGKGMDLHLASCRGSLGRCIPMI